MTFVEKQTIRDIQPPWQRRGWLTFVLLGVLFLMPGLAQAQRPFPGESLEPLSPPVRQQLKADPPLSQTTSPHSLSGISPNAVRTVAADGGDGVTPAEFSVEELLDEPLADVLIEGNKTIEPTAIMSRLSCRAGRHASPRQVQQDVKSLLDTRWFLDVRCTFRQTDAGPVLVFRVIERPIVKSVQFRGNKKIKTSELQAHTGLRPGHGYDVAANRESVQRIKNLYKEQGYRFAEVTLEKGNSPDDRDIIFNIVEGPKVKIWDVNIDGNRFSSDAVLKTKLKTKTVKVWFIGGDYDPDIIRNDVMALKQYYMGLGFFDVQVESEEVFSPDKSKVTVNFHVTEGRRYKVGSIEVVGNDVIPTSTLLKDPKLEKGDFFNARFLKEDVSTMKDLYDDQGRLFAEVKPVPQFRQEDDGWVDLVYQIDEDVPRYVGQIHIHIRGDYPHTREDVIRKQIHRYVKPGTLAKGRDLRMANARVSGSGLWDKTDPVAFDLKPVDGKEYWPQIAHRGQDQARDELQETAAVWTPQPVERVFGHSIAPMEISAAPTPVQSPAPIRNSAPNNIVPAVNVVPSVEPVAAEPMSVPPISRPVMPSHENKTSQQPAPAAFGIDPDFVFRGQSPVFYGPSDYRSQSLDAFGNPVPQDYLRGVSPQGDPYGDAFSYPPPGYIPPGFVDVNVDVTEGRTGRLMFGVGVNSDAGVVGQLVLQEDNFDILRPPRSWADIINGQAWRGAGQSFRLEAVPGSQVSRYMASWQDPFFLRTDFSLGVSGFYYNRFFRDWTEDRLGGRLSLGYVLDRYWSISSALRLEDVNIHGLKVPTPPEVLADSGDSFLSAGSVTLAFDTRDNAFVPSRGTYANLMYEQGFGEYTYPRADLSGGQYFTTYERPDGFGKHILSLTGEVGWTGDDTPFFERFYAGGYSSFRGFAFRGVTPVVNGFQVGGNFLMLGSAEYMVPLTADDNIRAVVFSDFGTVEPDVSLDQFRVSAGFGFRLVIPAMGPAPLAFDFAWPIMKEDFDQLRVFSFYVGFTR